MRFGNRMKRKEEQAPRALDDLSPVPDQLIVVAEQAQSGIAIIQNDIVRYANPSLAELLRTSLLEIIGRPYTDFICSSDSSSVVVQNSRGRADRERQRLQEACLRSKNGDNVYVEAEISSFTYSGKPASFVVLHDIDERKRAEEGLRASEEKYRSLVESTGDNVYLVGKDGTYLFMNDRYRARLGEPIDKLIGRRYRDFHTEAEDREFLEKLNLVFETGRSLRYEHRSLRDGKYVLRTLDPVIDGGGRVTAATVVSKDISELKEREAALRESEERYRLLFERNLAGLYRSSIDGRFLDCNKAFAQILGYDSPEAVAGLPASDLYFVPADREAFIAELRKHGNVANRECRLRRRDGSPVWVMETTSLIEEKRNGLAFLQGTLVDITERKQAAMRAHRTLMATIAAVAALAGTRDPYTAGHARRVTRLARAIATEMGLPQTAREALRVAGMLHDIGKMRVPAEILVRPGALSAAEFAIVREHPRIAYDILRKIEFPWPVAQIVLQHHERLDGSGYPLGIKGDTMLPAARILAVADVVEAMVSHRPYRPALGIEKALEEISRNKGILYADEVVVACLRLFREGLFRF